MATTANQHLLTQKYLKVTFRDTECTFPMLVDDSNPQHMEYSECDILCYHEIVHGVNLKKKSQH